MNECIIIGSAPIEDPSVFKEYHMEDAFLICADGGLDQANAAKLHPDLVVGDFDSAKSRPGANVETVRLSTDKDETDMMAAVDEGLRRGYKDFVLLGALGGRFDHSYANLCVLQHILSKGGHGMLANAHEKVFVMPGGRLHLRNMRGHTASVFPFGTANATITYTGMKYPLTEHVLTSDSSRGISNIIESDDATVTVLGGNVLIYVTDRP